VASTFPARDGDGTPPFVRSLAGYEASRFDTLVLVPRVPGAAPAESPRPGLRIERFPYFPSRWESLADGAIIENLRASPARSAPQVPAFVTAEALAIRAAVRRFRPAVVHLHWIVPQGLAALAAARGVPWVVTALGGDVYALDDPASRMLKSAVVRRAAALTTMSEDMRARVVALGAEPTRTHVVPMGADLETVRRLAAGVAREPGRVLFVGRLVEKKGAAVLLRALGGLPRELGWTLDVIGDGPLRAELEAAADGLPVRFLGQQPRDALARAMASAEIIVVPSLPASSGDQDGLPVALLEAMGLGSCVVASRMPGIDEAVEDGVSGLLVPPADPAALADALRALLADPGRRAALGAAAAARAEAFSMEATGARYVEILLDAARNGAPPR
jgi:colanic acid/amylovoran biosynthesis glycosyltransferase